MRICIIGKYPPIEGGVSMHVYWYAHSLAMLGHQVHVVTNAKEVELRFRIFMRPEDWDRCEGQYEGRGYVRVHWTDPYDRRQRHIPSHNPFVTKLVSLAIEVVEEYDMELIFSYYLEPYGVAGHVVSQCTGRPHIVKHAGSDMGLLYLHPQFRTFYDLIFRSARRVITGKSAAGTLVQRGVDEQNLLLGDDFRVPPSEFDPERAPLDLARLFIEISNDEISWPLGVPEQIPEGPFIGVYGKIGEAKGTFDLLRAVKRLKQRGHTFSLLLLGRGFEPTENRLAEVLADSELRRCVTRLQFLPHWRIPEFIRLCRAVCFLERDFPIAIHAPTVPREVLACGGCLIGSAEVLRRLFVSERLIHGLNCLAVHDVRDEIELSSRIEVALSDGEGAKLLGQRGYEYSRETERLRRFPRNYETWFTEMVTSNHSVRTVSARPARVADDDFPVTRMVMDFLPVVQREWVTAVAADYESTAERALAVYAGLLELVEKQELEYGVLVEAVRLELRLSGVVGGAATWASDDDDDGELFRLGTESRIVSEDDLMAMYPIRVEGVEIQEYRYDVDELLKARIRGELPVWVPRRASWAAFVPGRYGRRCQAFSISERLVHLVEACDGAQTGLELVTALAGDGEHDSERRERIGKAIIDCVRLGVLRLENHSRVTAQ